MRKLDPANLYDYDSEQRDALMAYFWQHPQEWQEFLKFTADMLYRVVLGTERGLPDDRNAALSARRALEYLWTPPERETVVIRRKPWTPAES